MKKNNRLTLGAAWLLVVTFCIGWSAPATAVPFSFTAVDTPLPIPDSGLVVSTIMVGPGSGFDPINDLNVFVDLAHGEVGTLVIVLRHVETGTEVRLFNRHGGTRSGQNLNEVTFDDEGIDGPISSGVPPYGPGSFVPFELLSAFDGESLDGTWQLLITDTIFAYSGTLFTFRIEGDAISDGDGDGVIDSADLCPGTVIPESVPTVKLGLNRWALVDGDTVFDTLAPQRFGPDNGFNTGTTGGCSCEQIIWELHLGKGHEKFGCSIGNIKRWAKGINP